MCVGPRRCMRGINRADSQTSFTAGASGRRAADVCEKRVRNRCVCVCACMCVCVCEYVCVRKGNMLVSIKRQGGGRSTRYSQGGARSGRFSQQCPQRRQIQLGRRQELKIQPGRPQEQDCKIQPWRPEGCHIQQFMPQKNLLQLRTHSHTSFTAGASGRRAADVCEKRVRNRCACVCVCVYVCMYMCICMRA